MDTAWNRNGESILQAAVSATLYTRNISSVSSVAYEHRLIIAVVRKTDVNLALCRNLSSVI